MIFLVLAFLLGSVPFGLIVARAFKIKDLRSEGSGNIGATNVARVAGLWPAGILAFALDLGKGALAVFLGYWEPVWNLLQPWPFLLSGLSPGEWSAWAAGLLAVLGHCYSPWLRFRGGKGVATGFGALLVLAPYSALGGFLVFGLIFFWTRISSLSSITGLVIASVLCVILRPAEPQLLLGALMIFVILMRHEENINALLEHRERVFTS